MDRMTKLLEVERAIAVNRDCLIELRDAMAEAGVTDLLTYISQADHLFKQISDRLQPIMGTEALANVRTEIAEEALVEASIAAYKAPEHLPPAYKGKRHGYATHPEGGPTDEDSLRHLHDLILWFISHSPWTAQATVAQIVAACDRGVVELYHHA